MIAIIGAGIAGLSLADALCRRGETVCVLDAGAVAGGASGVATAYIEPRLGDTPIRRLEQRAHREWPAYVWLLERETGLDCDFNTRGQLRVVAADEEEDFHEDLSSRRQAGWSVESLGRQAISQLEPSLALSITAGAVLPDIVWLNGRNFCRALARSIVSRGGTLRENTKVSALLHAEDEVVLHLASGEQVRADAVVLANGMDARDIAGAPEDIAPLRPVRGVNLIVDGAGMATPIRHMIKHKRGTLCPRGDGTLTVGTTYEAGERSWDVSDAIIERLYAHAEPVLPCVRDLPLLRVDAGIRTKTASGSVLVGRSMRSPRVFFSLGHAGSGYLRAPVIARELAAFIAGDQPSEDLQPLLHGCHAP